MSLITLTTDFGESSPYVAVMKGVILSINPAARLIDLSHALGPQDLRHGNYFLATAIPYFPAGTIHVAVVDPGVGTNRAILLAETMEQFVLAPDNGLLTDLFARHPPASVRRLTEPRFWRSPISRTFHGRDIFAPVAARLSLDPRPELFGTPCREWIALPGAPFKADGGRLLGCIQFVDHFGNLISNILADAEALRPKSVHVDRRDVGPIHWVKTYSEAPSGTLVGLTSSEGLIEIAVANGSAAGRLRVAAGAPVEIVR